MTRLFTRRTALSIAITLCATRLATAGMLVTGVDASLIGPPTVGVFKAPGGTSITSFNAFSASFAGGVRVAAGDFTGDTVPDIIAATGPGGSSTIHIFDGATFAPAAGPLGNFEPFGAGYTGGTYVTAGDVNGDGHADLVVGSGGGGTATVRGFSGVDGSTLFNFIPYGGFTGGVRVALGDTNGDGRAEVITAPAAGMSADIRVFDEGGNSILSWFYAYPQSYTGGAFVAAGDIDGDGLADIIVGPDAGAAPTVRVFDGGDPANVLNAFSAFEPNFTGGVRVAAGDVTGDGRADIFVAQGPGGTTLIHGFDAVDLSTIAAFNSYGSGFSAGAFIALPEPTLALSAIGAVALIARRKRGPR
jgi:serralysin